MPSDKPELPQVHPLVAALERYGEPTIALRGILGSSVAAVVRLYNAFDISSYVEIPKEKLIYVEQMHNGEPGEVRAFVPESVDILEVKKRRIQPSEQISPASMLEASRLPALERAPTFWTCAGKCEGEFAAEATQILISELVVLSNPDRPGYQQQLAQIAQRKQTAKSTLLSCLTQCVAKYSAPPFMAVPDDTPRGSPPAER